MSVFSYFAFAGAMFLLAVTPGPGVFVTVGSALASGFRHAVSVVAGIVAGDLLFLLFAVFGLAVLAEHLHGLFTAVKYIGAAYLIFLGVRLWRQQPETAELAPLLAQSRRSGFLTGLFITLGNPKVILFYLGFLPAFVDLASLTYGDILGIVAVVSLVLGTTLLVYAYAAVNAGKLFRSAAARRMLNRFAGGTMIAVGAALSTRA